ncbi:hypothetical protein TEA_017933 [Camellia sinensis var. sinensis]|uniref:Protein kinase domain-containing protein n=1 Tax=Camellia sinensis var. sinensis TaxID=542762 RepID=A0A4S4D954_CAMSN|nr:hypothetical protein TEA_017933 [Camellia sinensis var. sinensis]
MSLIFLLFLSLQLHLSLFSSSSSTTASAARHLHTTASSCPLDFDVLRRLIQSSNRPKLDSDFVSCHYIKASWIAEGCMNITTLDAFEGNVSKSALDDAVKACNQSLGNGWPCASCTTSLSSLKPSNLNGRSIGNLSDCMAYPSIYAAVFINRFGPTDEVTANYLFGFDFSDLSNSNGRVRTIVICVVVIGCGFVLFLGCGGFWILQQKREKIRERSKVDHERETNLAFGMNSINESTTLVRVTDFKNNSLSGSLPLDIQYDLPFLEELQLDSNKLSGQFPPSLWECKWLQILSLESNDFTGSISNNIGNLTLLRELHLGFNKLTGTYQTKLGLFLTSLHSKSAAVVWKPLGLLKTQDLNFTLCGGTLPEEIGNLNLERLSVSFTGLTGLIPSQIFNISTARIISLNGNQLSGHLPSSLGLWLPNLKELYLGGNKLSGTIPSSISNASKLTILFMTSNSFTGSIPNTLENLRLLRRFSVSENNLTRESSSLELNLITSLANCNNLKDLGIAWNQFNGILPASFGNLSTSLQQLEAFGCKLKGEIPVGIGNLSGLNVISLDDNEFTGFIPATIGRLECLDRLYLEHNRLQGTIPNDLCMLKNLGDLYQSDNKLNGSIPTCLGEQKTLRHIYLESNNLNSTIPLTLWSLRDLLGLNLSSNSLTGYIPLDIGNLRVITEIDLSWNQLSSDIPSTIGGAQTLVTLSLAHNKLQGPIPQSLGKLINLEFLDLSHNNLSRDIPQSLEVLRYLQYLNLSFNNLQGEIPTGGHFTNFTAESFMQNSGLCGAPQLQVPPCKTIHKSRKSLDLLKYILPSIAFAILVAAFVWIRCRKVNMALPIRVDSMIHSWRRFSYQELVRATNAFSESNLLGTGSFGSIYKGILSNGMSVAIKVFNLQTEGSFKSFDAECEVMCNIQHRNLLKILAVVVTRISKP